MTLWEFIKKQHKEIIRLRQRVEELERILRNIKNDPSVGKLVVQEGWEETPDY